MAGESDWVYVKDEHTWLSREELAEREPVTSRMAAIPTSQNGFPANNRAFIATMTAPGTGVRFPVRKGPCGELLMWAAGRWHNEVEALIPDACWGYAERDIRGSTEISNHASGTAIDLNAPQHPLGTTPAGNFTADQITAIHRIVSDAQGALRWGGDYVGRKDGMHLEINAPEAEVAAVLAEVNGAGDMPTKTAQQIDEMHEQLLGVMQAWAGGVTDDQGTPYNAWMFNLRNNVEIHQVALMCQKLLQRQTATPQIRVDVEKLATKLADHPAIAGLVAPADDDIVTVPFWKASAERAVRAFAATLLPLLGAGPVDVLHIAWQTSLSISLGAMCVSLLTSLVASQVGAKGSPSFLKGSS